MEKVIITGGLGFIGSNLINILKDIASKHPTVRDEIFTRLSEINRSSEALIIDN